MHVQQILCWLDFTGSVVLVLYLHLCVLGDVDVATEALPGSKAFSRKHVEIKRLVGLILTVRNAKDLGG